MVSTPEGITDNSPMDIRTFKNKDNKSTRKSLNKISEQLNVKQKMSVHRLGAAKKHKAIRSGNKLCSSIIKRGLHTKVESQVKKYLYNWVLHHYPQVLQSQMETD